MTKEDLPTLDSTEPISAPPGVTSEQFYLPTYTLLRAGPVSFTRRLLGPKEYEKKVFKYMQDFKEDSLMTAQGNADAYLASPDNWVEQKYFEQKGESRQRSDRKAALSRFCLCIELNGTTSLSHCLRLSC